MSTYGSIDTADLTSYVYCWQAANISHVWKEGKRGEIKQEVLIRQRVKEVALERDATFLHAFALVYFCN